MLNKTQTLLAVTAVALAGSAHAAINYSFEDFEGGTPNYTLTGTDPYTLTQLQSGDPAANIDAATALTGTDYTPQSPSRSGIFANGTVPGVSGEPTGQHGFVSASNNRNLTLTSPMSLVTDGVQSLQINFATMVYGLNTGFIHTVEVTYSALGDFTDTVQIATFSPAAVADPLTALAHYTVIEDTWSTLDLSISSTEVTFSDTAKIRFNKLAPFDTSQLVFLDDISVTGTVVPEPSAFAFLAASLGALVLIRRRRG